MENVLLGVRKVSTEKHVKINAVTRVGITTATLTTSSITRYAEMGVAMGGRQLTVMNLVLPVVENVINIMVNVPNAWLVAGVYSVRNAAQPAATHSVMSLGSAQKAVRVVIMDTCVTEYVSPTALSVAKTIASASYTNLGKRMKVLILFWKI